MTILLRPIKNFLYTWCLTNRQKATGMFPRWKDFIFGDSDFLEMFSLWAELLSGRRVGYRFFYDLDWHKQDLDCDIWLYSEVNHG